jgi:hypothetical protein
MTCTSRIRDLCRFKLTNALKAYILNKDRERTHTSMNNSPMFTKRHYEAVAETIQQIPTAGDKLDSLRREVVANLFVATFARDNGNFQRDRFLRACKPGANVRART